MMKEKRRRTVGQEKNREEFYKFLIQNQQKFYRLAFSFVKEQEAALDVVQEAVANGLASFDKLRQVEYMKTWFYRIVVNAAIQSLRKNGRYVTDEEVIAMVAQEEKGIGNEEKWDLYNAVMKLSEKYRMVIILRYFEDLKIQEVAHILKIPENTAKTRVRTALASLSKWIKEDECYE